MLPGCSAGISGCGEGSPRYPAGSISFHLQVALQVLSSSLCLRYLCPVSTEGFSYKQLLLDLTCAPFSGAPPFLKAMQFRAVHSGFRQTAFLTVILTIWQPRPHCHTQCLPPDMFPRLSPLGCASCDFPELMTVVLVLTMPFEVLASSLRGVTLSFETSVV